MEKRKQTVVGNLADVPEGFVAMASYGARKSGVRGSDRYEWILQAYERGAITAVKVMRSNRDRTGPVYVDADQAAEVIRAQERKPAPVDLFAEPKPPADTREDIHLRALLAAISVLSARLESIAGGIDRLAEVATARPEAWRND